MRYTYVRNIVTFREKRFFLGGEKCSTWGALEMIEIRRFREIMTRQLEIVAVNHLISIKHIELSITSQEFRFLRERCGVQGAQNDIPWVCTLAPPDSYLAFISKAKDNLMALFGPESEI
jgi:hypothetical protein